MQPNRHFTFYIDDVQTINFCSTTFYQVTGSKYEIPFTTKPTEGPHSLKTCEGCQKQKQHILTLIQDKNNKFPFCCPQHSKLITLKEFKKTDFNNLSENIANKTLFTFHHIINNIDSTNWKKDITDYIDYTIDSFGQFPLGYGEPFQLSFYFKFLLAHLKNTKDSFTSSSISDNEIDKRYNHIVEYLLILKEGNVDSSKTDLNVLIDTYNRWLKIFPFEMESYFGNLKSYYETHIPLLSCKPELNNYSGALTSKLYTKDSLIEALINLTNTLLIQINGLKLYEKGKLTDVKKIQLELTINKRKSKLAQGYKNNSNSKEKQYRRILKQWFNDEKQFLKEVSEILTQEEKKSIELQHNKHIKIFANDEAYTIFYKFHQSYQYENKHLAIYSSIFYAMEKDKYIICNQKEFIDFLATNYNIQIDKIDSRQSGENKRTKLYHSLKSHITKSTK